MNQAINTVTSSFARKKAARMEQFKQHIHSIPYFPIYQQYRSRPPLDPRIIHDIQRRMHAAEMQLQQGIDQDWKSCVVRYPEVLNHFYNQIQMQIPSSPPPFGQALAGGGQPRPASVVNSIPPPPQSMLGMSVPRSTTAPPKKNRERRSSKVNLDTNGLDGEMFALLGQKLEGIHGLGRGPSHRTKAATPAPQASTPAPRTTRPGGKRRESKDFKGMPSGGFMPPPPPPPPPPPSVPQAPGNYTNARNSFLGNPNGYGH